MVVTFILDDYFAKLNIFRVKCIGDWHSSKISCFCLVFNSSYLQSKATTFQTSILLCRYKELKTKQKLEIWEEYRSRIHFFYQSPNDAPRIPRRKSTKKRVQSILSHTKNRPSSPRTDRPNKYLVYLERLKEIWFEVLIPLDS